MDRVSFDEALTVAPRRTFPSGLKRARLEPKTPSANSPTISLGILLANSLPVLFACTDLSKRSFSLFGRGQKALFSVSLMRLVEGNAAVRAAYQSLLNSPTISGPFRWQSEPWDRPLSQALTASHTSGRAHRCRNSRPLPGTTWCRGSLRRTGAVPLRA